MKYFILLTFIGGVYAYIFSQPKTVSLISPIAVQNGSTSSLGVHPKVDTKVTALRSFFEFYHSPLVGLEEEFIQTADRNDLDWRLLPSISGAESSLGKNACGYNIFGWGSCSISFSSYKEAIETVGRKVATLSYYARYRQSGSLWDFATAYNFPYREKYYPSLTFFVNEIKKGGSKL